MSSHPLTAPKALRRPGITWDNIALAPASLLPYRARYQAIANGLPRGDILIVLPTTDSPQKRTLEHTAQLFEAKGKRVTTITATDVV
jgi:hypothetical protein